MWEREGKVRKKPFIQQARVAELGECHLPSLSSQIVALSHPLLDGDIQQVLELLKYDATNNSKTQSVASVIVS